MAQDPSAQDPSAQDHSAHDHSHPADGGHDCCGGKAPPPLDLNAPPSAAPMAALPETVKDPVCGMDVKTDPEAAKPTSVYKDQTYFFCCNGCKTKFEAEPEKYLAPVKDPVCGMTVEPGRARYSARHDKKPYFFCSSSCETKFKADPGRYVEGGSTGSAPPPPEKVPEGTIYTCPMDPEIRQIGPGICPICGMALEPEIVTLDEGPNAELADMTRRFWIGLALTLPVFVLEMGQHLLGLHLLPQQTSNYVQFLLATPVVLWVGKPFFERGWLSLKSRHFNMFTLIALGTGVAYLYSLLGTFAPGLSRMISTPMKAACRSISRRPPSSPCWWRWARCWSSTPANRPPAPSRRCCHWRRRPPCASGPMVPTKP